MILPRLIPFFVEHVGLRWDVVALDSDQQSDLRGNRATRATLAALAAMVVLPRGRW